MSDSFIKMILILISPLRIQFTLITSLCLEYEKDSIGIRITLVASSILFIPSSKVQKMFFLLLPRLRLRVAQNSNGIEEVKMSQL